jgi:hypothetical protein
VEIERYIRRLALLLATAALLIFPGHAGASSCPDANALPLPALVSMPKLESSILCLLNEQRAAYGLTPLTTNSQLTEAARGHSSSMRSAGFFAHDSADGSPFSSRIAASGYLLGATGWAIGENIGWGSSVLGSPQSLVTAWMNSPEHRDNILNSNFSEIGVGGDWGSPIDPNLLPAMIATTDFGSAVHGTRVAGSSKYNGPDKKHKKKKKRKRKRRR